MTDVAGNKVCEGAILKVFHFVGARNKKHFMYKQVGCEVNGLIEIKHLPINKDSGHYWKKKDEILGDSLVIACYCEEHIYKDLKNYNFKLTTPGGETT